MRVLSAIWKMFSVNKINKKSARKQSVFSHFFVQISDKDIEVTYDDYFIIVRYNIKHHE